MRPTWAGYKRLVPLLLAAGCSILAGCAVVDEYSGRATVYNLQSEQAHDQGILLNIVRASLRRPRQFTIVQKITGTATAAGTANVMFPFGPHLATGSATNSTMFAAELSGGPQFEVATLETNDFYAGLLQPIPAQLVDLYMHAEFPRDLLLNLFIEKIVMRRTDRGCQLNHLPQCEIVFQNYPGVRLQLEFFQSLVGYLINLGLSTERVDPPTAKKAPKAKGKSKSSDDSDDSSDDDDDSGGAPVKVQPYAFCFTPRLQSYRYLVPAQGVCGNQMTLSHPGRLRLTGRSVISAIRISPDFAGVLASIINLHRDEQANAGALTQFDYIRSFSGQTVSLAIYPRSTETLIYYLGEVVRRRSHPDFDQQMPLTVQTKIVSPLDEFDLIPCSISAHPGCTPIFVLEENAAPSLSSTFTVTYEGIRYSVPADAGAGSNYETAAGASYTVLSIVRQLVILNTKAKSLPATSVLTVRSP
jgi:hypothetical protein